MWYVQFLHLKLWNERQIKAVERGELKRWHGLDPEHERCGTTSWAVYADEHSSLSAVDCLFDACGGGEGADPCITLHVLTESVSLFLIGNVFKNSPTASPIGRPSFDSEGGYGHFYLYRCHRRSSDRWDLNF